MIADSGLAAARPAAGVRVRVGARATLAFLVLGSALVRTLVALAHRTPSYFPDEYIYSSIGRSLGEHARPLIRGGPAHFPALLEPLLAAPLWAIAATGTAYRLVEAENALLMSLAAVPAYLLARRLELSAGYALVCAAFAIVIPDLAFSGGIIADPLAYPLVLGALTAGVAALQRPSRAGEAAFLAFAALATFARVQYVVLVPAFLVAALVVERRRAVRVHALVFVVVGAGAAAVALLGPGGALGYYSTVGSLHVGVGLLRWLGLELFLLVLAGGVALAPGAIVGIFSPREKAERAFSALAVPFAAAVLFEAALYSANGSDRFKERYLFVLLPLLPIAFGLYRRRGRPARTAVTVLAAVIAALAAMLPLSAYAAGAGFDDSPLLWCVTWLEWRLGIGTASLVFALCATGGALLAVIGAWSRFAWPALAGAFLVAAALSVGASRFDVTYSKPVRQHLVAPTPSWIDAANLGSVSAIQTPDAPGSALLEQLFWNRSIGHELLLGPDATPTDAFAVGKITVGRGGTLRTNGQALRGPILFQGFLATPALEGFTPVGRFYSFTLWRQTGAPRLRLLELGRFWDGWLGVRGKLEVWPPAGSGGSVFFTLSLPASWAAPVTVRFGARSYRVSPGERLPVRLLVPASSRLSVPFFVRSGAGVLPDRRPVSLRSTTPVFLADGGSLIRRGCPSLGGQAASGGCR